MLRARGQSQVRIDCQLFKNRVVFLQLVHESSPAKSDIKRMKPRGAVFPAIGEKQASSRSAMRMERPLRPRSDHFTDGTLLRVQNPDGLPASEIRLRSLHMTTSGTGDLDTTS
jgi:hypothetical protein